MIGKDECPQARIGTGVVCPQCRTGESAGLYTAPIEFPVRSGIRRRNQRPMPGIEIRVNQLAERQRSMVTDNRLQKQVRLQTTRYGTPITRFVLKNTTGT